MPQKIDRSLDTIGFYTISEQRAQHVSTLYRRQDPLAFTIVRAELILESQCNLHCRFCKGLPPISHSRFSVDAVRRILQEWLPGGAQYIHLTGGEPTVYPRLLDVLKGITATGAIPCMTSNGVAPFALYRDLIENGLRDIRISLHAHNARSYERITGTGHAFKQVMENIRQLVRLRDQAFPDVYIMINTCVMQETLPDLPRLLQTLMALQPNDIKPVAIVQLTGAELKSMQDYYAHEILPDLLEIVPPTQFPILRYRLPTLLTTRLRGFPGNSTPATLEATPHCFLMLDDRCVDAEWYYPCNIYLREQGPPLGSHQKDDAQTVAERIWDFVQHHDVRHDPICRSCCPDVVREYNLYVEKLLQNGHSDEPPARQFIC
ncbi:radical SAM protein [candidate division KSB3 bacterium]|uniref:Radical SAM protein n=1 Tax=candidate division KSB3 bacterium TaxID=2044937 RepID=A0A9D5Q6B9_9BACT|nr:radical SAM protein [candidate division KSB3 bacterium]MBD3325679.1 radical SAM protein [candidate division KSB3 bacterium]